jgi:sulfoacetaldehyde dehydrogenase
MVGMAINAVKCRNAVMFSPHPASKNTALEVNRILRAALKDVGASEDLVQSLEKPSIPLAQEVMSICDLTVATGGPAMVKSAYSSGKPAYGVGAGNATVVVDESANVEEAARNTRISKIHNNGSGCSCDGNLIIEETLYDQMLEQLQKEGGYLCNEEEKAKLKSVLWDNEHHRLIDTVARRASEIAEKAGIDIGDSTFIFVEQEEIGKQYPFSGEKLSPVLAVFKYKPGFENALDMVAKIFEVGGKGHSCGIASYNDENIDKLALMAPVSRIMVRQPNVSGNAGSFTNGMPMTPSLGCGTWGGNIISENVTTKHYMNTTWVSRTIPEDKPTEEEIFGKFYNAKTFL